jgi:hypothetical protein
MIKADAGTRSSICATPAVWPTAEVSEGVAVPTRILSRTLLTKIAVRLFSGYSIS